LNIRQLLPAAAAIALLVGCAAPTAYSSTPGYNRYRIEDIIAMSKAGERDEQIIAKLQATSDFFPLTASEIVKLHGEGVSLAVLDYLQETRLRAIRNEERFQMPRRFNSEY
jgi:uncharacterized lipoprotein YajG